MTTKPEAWPDLAGRLVANGHVLPIRIYFEDTDFSGVVYHANFLRFMERGRSDMLRLLAISHDDLNAGISGESLAFAVRRVEADFLKPARMDDFVEVKTEVIEVTGARLIIGQSVCRGSETLVTAKFTIVMINAARRARRLPLAVRNKLAAIEL